MTVTSKEAGLWLLMVMTGLGGCDGTAIFIPEDNTRLSWSEVPPSSAPYAVQVLLDENEHAWASDPNNDWSNLFMLEGYSDRLGWHPVLASPPYYTGIPVTLPTGTSYWWRFEIDLGHLGLYFQPGTWGPSFMFRLYLMDSSGEWREIPGLTVSWQECLRMLDEDQEAYCPYTYEVRLRAPTYVPNVQLGAICSYGETDCSRCVPNLPEQAGRIFDPGEYTSYGGFTTFDFGNANAKSHNQGIARFVDRVYNGTRYTRIAASYNNSYGFSVSASSVASEFPAWHASSEVARIDIRTPLNHPGGMQAHGDIVAVAMEQTGSATPKAQVLFYQVTGNPLDPDVEALSYHILDGSQGEPFQASQSRAASAGFVKLASGYFLLAIAGADNGKQGIWFYESSSTTINLYTTWHFIDFWSPPCVGWGQTSGGEHCFAGAGGALALLTGCDGRVYLYALGGTRDLLAKDYSETQFYRLDQDAQTGEITPAFIFERRKSHGRASAKDESFRWAAGTHVMSDGLLTVAGMIRKERGVGPQPTRTKAYVANSMCQITTSDPNVCGIAIYLHGNNPLIGENEGVYVEDNDAYDVSVMDWPQSEEDLHDYEVSLPDGAT